MPLETEWTEGPDSGEQARQPDPQRVSQWRAGGYVGVTATTARLLEYWTNPERERKLFFCQIEAVETAIYITEVAKKYGDAWIENELRDENDTYESRTPARRPEDGHRLRQDGGDGDADRLARRSTSRQHRHDGALLPTRS